MCALNDLHVQEHVGAVQLDGGVPAVGQRTRQLRAQAGDVELVAAEGLGVGLDLEGAEVEGDGLPNQLVALHQSKKISFTFLNLKRKKSTRS